MRAYPWHDDPRWLARRKLEQAQARAVADAILESGRSVEEVRPQKPFADPARMRGVPVVGYLPGAIRGSRPTDVIFELDRAMRGSAE